MRCDCLYVVAEEWTAGSLLWEKLKSLCSDLDGQSPTLPSGCGVVFLEQSGGFLVQVVIRRTCP